MGRRSYGGVGRRSAGPAFRPNPPPTKVSQAPPPAPAPVKNLTNQAPPPAPAPIKNVTSQAPLPAPVKIDIGSTIVEGMAFGTGNALGHRLADAVIGPRVIQHEMVNSGVAAAPAPAPAASSKGDSCGHYIKAFQECVNSNVNDIGKCQFYVDMLTECKRSSGSMMS